MRVRDFVFAAATALVGSAGCYATTSGYYSTSYAYIVPPPRAENFVYRPGYVWVRGHWDRDGGAWRWRPGYYEPTRAGYIWVDGHWTAQSGRWVWIRGGWYTRGGVAVLR
jgi:hypothetical protein